MQFWWLTPFWTQHRTYLGGKKDSGRGLNVFWCIFIDELVVVDDEQFSGEAVGMGKGKRKRGRGGYSERGRRADGGGVGKAMLKGVAKHIYMLVLFN